MVKKQCEDCGTPTPLKHLGKIRGILLCKKCRSEVRKEHREKTIKDSIERERIEELSKESKEGYEKAEVKRERRKNQKDETPPIIKGSKQEKNNKSVSYHTFEDKKQLLRILMKKGLDFEEARGRLKQHAKQQKLITEKMKAQNKPEEEIKIKQQELLEELWNS